MTEVKKTGFGWQVTNTALLKHVTVKTKTRAMELKAEFDADEAYITRPIADRIADYKNFDFTA